MMDCGQIGLWDDHAVAASSDAPGVQPGEGGSQPTLLLQSPTAHQRLIRESRANTDADVGLFGQYWPTKPDIAAAIVRSVSYITARELILKYEWLGSMPAVVFESFGIYFDDVLGGVVVYGSEMSANLKDKFFDRLGVADRVICLARGACVHWAHPNAASKLIRLSMRMLPDKWSVITATTDPSAGEIGTIYQACGFHFLGQRWGDENSVVLDGHVVSTRTLQARFGTRSTVSGLGGSTQYRLLRKGRYVAFRGSRAERAELRDRFDPFIEPYPKRAA